MQWEYVSGHVVWSPTESCWFIGWWGESDTHKEPCHSTFGTNRVNALTLLKKTLLTPKNPEILKQGSFMRLTPIWNRWWSQNGHESTSETKADAIVLHSLSWRWANVMPPTGTHSAATELHTPQVSKCICSKMLLYKIQYWTNKAVFDHSSSYTLGSPQCQVYSLGIHCWPSFKSLLKWAW